MKALFSWGFIGRLRPFWLYFSQAKHAIGVAVLATMLAAATEPMIPQLLKIMLDDGFGKAQFSLWLVPVAFIGLFGLRGLSVFVGQYALTYTAQHGLFHLRAAMMRRLHEAHPDLFRTQSASKLSNTVVYEVQNGTGQLVQAILSGTKDILTMLALLGYLFWLNWRLTLIVLLLFPALIWMMRVLSKRMYALWKRNQDATDELAYVVEESVLAWRMIRLHDATHAQHHRFAHLSQTLRRLALKSAVAHGMMMPTTQILAATALSAVVATALWQSQQTGLTAGHFVAFITAMLLLIAPIRHLADVTGPLTRGLASLERGLQLIEQPIESQQGTHQTPRSRGALRFENVWVTYTPPPTDAASDENTPPHPTPATPTLSLSALAGVDLDIAAGEIVALVGTSGAGKTTLVNLLPRFIEPSQGCVRLDGVALTDWHLPSLRAQMALVSQDVVMLNDSVAANVALGQCAHAESSAMNVWDEDRIHQALKAAHLDDWVASLPQGIYTVVGHNATLLSGGQRQRLAIARAIYKDAPILILDEATSALDNVSERMVQTALATLMQGRTTLIIAHRLSTIVHADKIVVMQAGRVVEIGTHPILLQQKGVYADLYHSAGLAHQTPSGKG